MESDKELNYSESDDGNQSNSINDCLFPTTSTTHKKVNIRDSKFAKFQYELRFR